MLTSLVVEKGEVGHEVDGRGEGDGDGNIRNIATNSAGTPKGDEQKPPASKEDL